jgi:hypothetical protein
MHKLSMVLTATLAVLFGEMLAWKSEAATETGYRVAQATSSKRCPKGYTWDNHRGAAMCRPNT